MPALFVSAFSFQLRRAHCHRLCTTVLRQPTLSTVPSWVGRTPLRRPALHCLSSYQFDSPRQLLTIRALKGSSSTEKGGVGDESAKAGGVPLPGSDKQPTGKPRATGTHRGFSSSTAAENAKASKAPGAKSAPHRTGNLKYDPPPLDERDLEESFVKGSGAGGQKINKTSSCVVLRHIPSGVTVRCQESRSQSRNRTIARKILQKKLDEIERGEQSLIAQEASKARARKLRRRRKSVKKHFKSRRDQQMMDARE